METLTAEVIRRSSGLTAPVGPIARPSSLPLLSTNDCDVRPPRCLRLTNGLISQLRRSHSLTRTSTESSGSMLPVHTCNPCSSPVLSLEYCMRQMVLPAAA